QQVDPTGGNVANIDSQINAAFVYWANQGYNGALIAGGCPAFLLNIEKRSLPRLMLSGDGLASKDAV
ncbi:MAG: hypothetical protein WBW33_31540, partial [Bryobacteraceae bacterium]